MNQAANSIGLCKARYRGRRKVELEHHLGATAINITRLDAYFSVRHRRLSGSVLLGSA
jgi:RecB family endonuclease NucS